VVARQQPPGRRLGAPARRGRAVDAAIVVYAMNALCSSQLKRSLMTDASRLTAHLPGRIIGHGRETPYLSPESRERLHMWSWLGNVLEKSFGVLPDAGVSVGLFAALIVLFLAVVRGAFVDAAKERLRPFIKQHLLVISLIALVVALAAVMGALLDDWLFLHAGGTAIALIVVILWHYLRPAAALHKLPVMAQASLVLLPLVSALGYTPTGSPPAPGRFIVVHTFDRQGILPDGETSLDEEDLLRLSVAYLGKLKVIYRPRIEVRPDGFEEYRKHIYTANLSDLPEIPFLRLENRVRQEGDRVIFLTLLRFHDDLIFDAANFISVPADLVHAHAEQAFLLAAYEIMRRIEKRPDLNLSTADKEEIKKAIVGELTVSWLARGEIDGRELDDIKLLREASNIPDDKLRHLLERHMTMKQDELERASTGGHAQYMNYATML
jgi:hypothetical protein